MRRRLLSNVTTLLGLFAAIRTQKDELRAEDPTLEHFTIEWTPEGVVVIGHSSLEALAALSGPREPEPPPEPPALNPPERID